MGIQMREVLLEEYLEFVKNNNRMVIEDQVIELKPIDITRLHPASEELTDVSTTVWSFPKRGSWATHKGDYRGNWAPQIPRALMLMYTKPGDIVLDPMIGSGTTCIEAKLLGRNCIGVDINYNAVILTLHRLYYLNKYLEERKSLIEFLGVTGTGVEEIKKSWFKIYHGDARKLDLISDESIDLVATHPPYFNIIEYSSGDYREGDLSRAKSLEEYLEWTRMCAREFYRVLKPGRYCAILISDTRIHKHYVPISHYVLRVFLEEGFILKEEVIKIQHKTKTTREVWRKISERDFLLIEHEKLYIFRKPLKDENKEKYKYSMLVKT